MTSRLDNLHGSKARASTFSTCLATKPKTVDDYLARVNEPFKRSKLRRRCLQAGSGSSLSLPNYPARFPFFHVSLSAEMRRVRYG